MESMRNRDSASTSLRDDLESLGGVALGLATRQPDLFDRSSQQQDGYATEWTMPLDSSR